jgi:hypothetical protein
MIARLRRSHSLIWAVLAFLLPALWVAAWASRRAPVMMEKLPDVLQAKSSP